MQREVPDEEAGLSDGAVTDNNQLYRHGLLSH
jgi:hypothetical protein